MNAQPKCFVCDQTALMGYHPLCVLNSALATAISTKLCKEVCVTCPFRKGTVWMDRGRLLLNRLRVKYSTVQDCHETYYNWLNDPQWNPINLCRGNLICLDGGDDEVYSPGEFERVKPSGSLKETKLMFSKRSR